MTQHNVGIPTSADFKAELERSRRARRRRSVIGSTIGATLLVICLSVVAATYVFPTYSIYGTSMSPTVENGDVVVAVKPLNPKPGDIVAFRDENRIMVKRVIAEGGDFVDIADDGTVSVNGTPLSEPYLNQKTKGACTIALPCLVPEGSLFVLGDNRESSADSRNAQIGCISQTQVVSTVVFRIWPVSDMKLLYR